jgi:hypothetical protein
MFAAGALLASSSKPLHGTASGTRISARFLEAEETLDESLDGASEHERTELQFEGLKTVNSAVSAICSSSVRNPSTPLLVEAVGGLDVRAQSGASSWLLNAASSWLLDAVEGLEHRSGSVTDMIE